MFTKLTGLKLALERKAQCQSKSTVHAFVTHVNCI